MRTMFVVMSLSLAVMLAACSKKSTAPTQPSTSSSSVPNWNTLGFPTVMDSTKITPGTADTLVSGPYKLEIPGNVFASPVEFDLLSGDTSTFAAGSPPGNTPILAFAFKVRDLETDSLVGEFQNPLTCLVKDSQIDTASWYYDIKVDGVYVSNSAGMKVAAGLLTHPIKGALYGWVITSPDSSSSSGGSGGGW